MRNGEAEWVKNAPDTYSHDALDVWHTDILPRIMSARLEQIDIEDLRLFCPKMLGQLPHVFASDTVETVRDEIKKILNTA